MSTKTVRSALLDALQDLSKTEFDHFCYAILGRGGEPRVRQEDLEGKDRAGVASVLLRTFTESGVKEVVVQTLGEIRCNAQKESFAKDINEPSSTPPSTPVFSYGDIMKVETTGASLETAQQDNLNFSGIRASHAMAETDLVEMITYISVIKKVAQQKGLDPALIAAIISRSCRAGKTLCDGWGSFNGEKTNTFGLMQIEASSVGGVHALKGEWDDEKHLSQATDILIRFIIRIKHKFPEWSQEQQLKGGIAAYNAGDGNILSYEKVDSKTSSGDYSNDVVARAQCYKKQGLF